MKIKKIVLSVATLGLLSMPSLVSAEEESNEFSWLDRDTWSVEASGEVITTIGAFTGDGSTNNAKSNGLGDTKYKADTHTSGDLYRSEVTAKLFLNQEVGDESSWHAELQLNKNGNGEDGYDFTRNYSQFDWLRELYIDTTSGENISWRIGKQQVVWGKADGVKFLDIINPTDFRNWGQDSMEDSRIPLWMITGEYALNADSSIQVVYVPQVDVGNQIPGFYKPSTGDQGEAFVPLGTDALFGQYNGFYNIGPDLGEVANVFYVDFGGNHTTSSGNLVNTKNQTVATYVAGALSGSNDKLNDAVLRSDPTTNLFNGVLNTENPVTMFDYMGDTTFSTFDAFVNMKTKYVKDNATNKPLEGNLGIKYSGATDSGLNYTFNYYYHYDNNPVVDMSWEGSSGHALSTKYDDSIANFRTVSLVDSVTGADYNQTASGAATMVFTERQNRINTFGMSFDYAIDNSFAPVIVRSEIVYDKDTLVPVVDLGKLAFGDLVGAFTNEKASFLNYVIGLDVTVMTNLFVSFQFMDKWNLDYVDEKVQYQGNTRAYSKHTANAATMSLSNGFKQAEEHAIAYTLFLSKPFLESDALRVNNIFLLENDAYGWWDRFDVEYSYSDDIVLTAAINQYGGDSNGVFGQFYQMSNAQVGFKYIF